MKEGDGDSECNLPKLGVKPKSVRFRGWWGYGGPILRPSLASVWHPMVSKQMGAILWLLNSGWCGTSPSLSLLAAKWGLRILSSLALGSISDTKCVKINGGVSWSLKRSNIPVIPLLDGNTEELKTVLKCKHIPMFIAALFKAAKSGSNPHVCQMMTGGTKCQISTEKKIIHP